MARVEFVDASIAVDGAVVLSEVSLDIADGEFIGVIGPSGSGKTSLIRAIAGLSDVVAGRLLLDGADVTSVKTADRDVGMVFQEPVMFPTRNVRRNVAFPLEIRRQAPHEISERVDAEVRAMHLEHLLGRRPHELSRGETQMVQIARAMVRTPRVLLLDEPLACLDRGRQAQMRSELSLLQEGYGVTTVMATNDPVDAMTMPSRLIVLHGGQVVQVDAPARVHRLPATVDAAVGTGECLLLPASVSADGTGFWLTVDRRHHAGSGDAALRHRAWSPALAEYVGQQVVFGVRPDDVVTSESGPIEATVTKVIPGVQRGAAGDLGGWRCGLIPPPGVQPGDVVRVQIDHFVVFDQATGRAIG